MKTSKLSFGLFVAPCLIAFLLVVIIPTFSGILMSFTDWNGIDANPNFVGLTNYVKAFTDDMVTTKFLTVEFQMPRFINVFLFTAEFAIVSVILINAIGFGLALLVTRGLKGSNILRSVFFIPNLIGGLILGFLWQFIFTKVFNHIGDTYGIEFLKGWLSTTGTGFWGLVIVLSWQMSGYMMIIYIAAIQNIPSSLFEAADLDGANFILKLKNIIVPLVAQASTVGLFLTLSNAFKLFDQNLALTNGGPYLSTQMLALNIYRTAFVMQDFGQGQAKAVIFLIAVSAITLTQMSISKKKEVEF
ncbi:sugar ABC transporter permease [Thiospirochaeta perfilievii]|uniref:Sugar ABC transporter permease n=1 Tax=Thiospirochaeta perfilievii TaxID=252967 RepID=A0A5C1QAT0_9SPIO|nr:sugar ABC transporter permease [Thiospirochaeta perfilievii]QEN04458.1 sugar ABC transporter permease [Thiospirochaeta perfilievii]